jgi:hypothetical protein
MGIVGGFVAAVLGAVVALVAGRALLAGVLSLAFGREA